MGTGSGGEQPSTPPRPIDVLALPPGLPRINGPRCGRIRSGPGDGDIPSTSTSSSRPV